MPVFLKGGLSLCSSNPGMVAAGESVAITKPQKCMEGAQVKAGLGECSLPQVPQSELRENFSICVPGT